MRGPRWLDEEMVVCREIYEVYGPYPPGGVNNLVIRTVATALGRTPDSVYKRLSNYVTCDPAVSGTGLRSGKRTCMPFFFMRAKEKSRYRAILRSARSKYGLNGVI